MNTAEMAYEFARHVQNESTLQREDLVAKIREIGDSASRDQTMILNQGARMRALSEEVASQGERLRAFSEDVAKLREEIATRARGYTNG